MVTVQDVLDKSPASKAGIRKDDKVISINDNPFNDILDLIYAESEENLEILIEGKLPIRITKRAYEPLGIIFNESIEIRPKHCTNKCLFCFIDQLPKGMRETMYVKDDDYRLSFCTGSYVTLTNLNDSDIDRIIKYHLSPLYISVHSYNNDIRRKLIANPKTDDMFNIIKRLAKNGIVMHAQIVLCPSINDGEILEETLKELYGLYPNIATVAVVPVGLTKYRDNLYALPSVTCEDARSAIDITSRIDNEARSNATRGFCWCSDEMYLRADIELPHYEYYGDFMQIENGVGMIRTFIDEISYSKYGKGAEYHLITGESFYPILVEIAKKLEQTSRSRLIIHKIVNNYFGESVTVAGLITARDIIEQLKGKVNGKRVIIPCEMLKEFDNVFLDGMKIDEVEKALNIKIYVSNGGQSLENIICGE